MTNENQQFSPDSLLRGYNVILLKLHMTWFGDVSYALSLPPTNVPSPGTSVLDAFYWSSHVDICRFVWRLFPTSMGHFHKHRCAFKNVF